MQSVALADGDACFENLQTLDRQLARAARISGPLRFALGAGLNALAERDGYGIEAPFHAARHTPKNLRSLRRDTIRLRVEPELRAAMRATASAA